MSDLKEFLVTVKEKEKYIVTAKDTKEAIEYIYANNYARQNRVWKEENDYIGFEMNHIYTKDEFVARSLGSLHTENGRIICVA